MRFETQDALELARRAAMKAGASEAVAASLADATVSAEWAGNRAVGFAHLPDYLDGFVKGRIAKDAAPEIDFAAPAVIQADAKRGIAQLGFDRAFAQLVERTHTYGVTVFSQSNSFTVGELGYYTRRLAQAGLVALAVTNATAQMTTLESRKAVYGTNPLSFGAPRDGGKPFVIDQASSSTAFVNVRRAAERGETIPEGWAVDAHGQPTTDAREAVKGLLLAFGGARGANIALMVEILAAGLTGGNWSLDAPSFAEGEHSPAVGLFIVALAPRVLAGDFEARLSAQLERLAAHGVRIPGSHLDVTELDIADELIAKIEAL
ncbi:malate/L-lactate dehydrogenase [Caballeronia hypogeia]|uniref:Malate/L-lactate dehydrogenase n=1 Tax=Caballeronia hypogeia TaxID=1777140 RepID=A0A158D7J4_9BURK|nr:Ldh family oxidoreductase [Caballeronia hypogeia]SAK90176.1 malate/L-lactate dehydrogenase [Caballeronia hypogeia]